MIEKEPSYCCRTVDWFIGFNKNTVLRIFRIKSWHLPNLDGRSRQGAEIRAIQKFPQQKDVGCQVFTCSAHGRSG